MLAKGREEGPRARAPFRSLSLVTCRPKMASFARLGFLLLVACLLLLGACGAEDTAVENAEPMSQKDAYEILGVTKRTSDKEIRRIFKEKSLVSLRLSESPPPFLSLTTHVGPARLFFSLPSSSDSAP